MRMGSRAGILLIAHRYAPYSRVGAYRWVRLSSRLARRGHPVHVLTVHWPRMEPMEWLSEAETPGITIHRTRSGFPQQLKYGRLPIPKLDQSLGRGLRFLARAFPAYDESSNWGRFLLPEAKRLIDLHALQVVVATGGPFTAHHFAAQIKHQRPRVKLIQDFRDPWFLTLDEAEAAGWKENYQNCLKAADAVVGVTTEMTDLLRGHCPSGPRFLTIENGVELELLRQASAGREQVSRDSDFVYAGSIFSERHVPLLPFFEWMRERRRSFEPIRLKIIGRVDRRLPAICADLLLSGDVKILEPMPQKKVFDEILGARMALHLNAPKTNDTQVSTKLLEYAALGVPTVSLNYGGAADTLVRDSRLGWSVDAGSNEFSSQLDAIWSSTTPFAPDLERFDFESLADRYCHLITEVVSSSPQKGGP